MLNLQTTFRSMRQSVSKWLSKSMLSRKYALILDLRVQCSYGILITIDP